MSKEAKIIIFSVLVVFILSALFLFTESALINTRLGLIKTAPAQVDLIKLDQDYRLAVKKIVSDYSDPQTALTKDKIGSLKAGLLALTVPAKFRDLHYSLILAMDKMTDYLNNGDSQAKLDSQQLISQAKTDYPWLN